MMVNPSLCAPLVDVALCWPQLQILYGSVVAPSGAFAAYVASS
jgi:hypothetical protein